MWSEVIREALRDLAGEVATQQILASSLLSHRCKDKRKF
jgi:Arc/MetJ-type ribon-helix-helix transcriptional regulator